jgi:hypothetical protein
MRSRRLATLVLAAFLTATHAYAAKFEKIDLPGAPGGAILMSGVIETGDDTKFHALAETMPRAVVVTTGPGGRVLAAVNIGTEIRERGWTTLVPPSAICASACTFIWLAGVHREIADDGRIGFHAMSVIGATGRQEVHNGDLDLHRWLNWLGYNEDTTATIVNTPAALVRWLDRSELVANGIECEQYSASAQQ